MPRIRQRVLLLGIAVSLVTFLVIWWCCQPAELSLKRMQSVTVGMSRKEVRDAVGLPAGSYPKDVPYFFFVGVRIGHDVWHCASSGSELNVWYDESGQVNDLAIYQPGVLPERLIVRIRPGQAGK
jgi:hypothetical protein